MYSVICGYRMCGSGGESRKYVFPCYFGTGYIMCIFMTMLNTMQRVHEDVPFNTTYFPKTTVLNNNNIK